MADLDKTDPLASMLGDGYSKLDQAGKVAAAGSFLKSRDEAEKAARGEAGKRAEGQLISEFGPSLYSKPYEEFKPSQESMSGFAALGSLMMVAGTMMGSKGRLAGIGAMNNIAGMLKGYQSGRKDLYEQERQQFEENMKIQERNRADIKEAFNLALKMAPTNLRGAEDFLNKTFASKGMTMPQAMLKTSGVMHTIGTVNGALDRADDITKQIADSLGYKGVTSRKDLEARIAAQAAGTTAQSAAEEAALKKRKELATTQLEEKKLSGSGLTPEQQLKEDQDRKLAEALAADPSKITTNPDRDLVIKYTGKVFDVVDKPKTVKEIAQQKVRNEAMINSTAESAGTLESIAKLPGPGTAGILANIGNREGILGYLSSTAARSKLESDQASLLNSWWTGLGSNLATLEKTGASTGLVGLADKFEKLKPLDGDSQIVVAGKLADARDLIVNTMNAVKREKILSPDEESALDQELSRVTKAIPFSRIDVTNALMKQLQKEGKDPKSIGNTLGELILGKAPSSTTPSPSTTPGASKTPYLRGREIEVRNGKWVFKDTGEDAK
jgi:hypothetical protein